MKRQAQHTDINKLKSYEIGQLVINNWKRIEYVCHRRTERVISAIKHRQKYDDVSCVEWTSPEGLLFWLFVDYRHQTPVMIPCIVGGTNERPKFYFPQNYIDTGAAQIDCYTYHFMERYRQRTSKLVMPMREVVGRFALANISNICIWQDEDDSRRAFAVRQGLAFAKADRVYNRWIYTTYVSNDMLGETQREAKAIIQELLDRQDTLFNGAKKYHQAEWDLLDAVITQKLKRLRPIAQEIYNSYYEEINE